MDPVLVLIVLGLGGLYIGVFFLALFWPSK
jgi:hypothetical protein